MAAPASSGSAGRPPRKGKREAFLDGFRTAKDDNLVADFRQFVRGIRPGPRPTLHAIHSLLPHRPWRYTADGRRYPGGELPGYRDRRWTDSVWQAAQGYQRHLVQVQLVDRLLGELLDQLEQRGLYDRSLVVVAADHGVSFTPGTALRVATRETFGEIGAVPCSSRLPASATVARRTCRWRPWTSSPPCSTCSARRRPRG